MAGCSAPVNAGHGRSLEAWAEQIQPTLLLSADSQYLLLNASFW